MSSPHLPDPETVLADIGEDELLDHLFPLLPEPPASVLGPGDDAAVLAMADPRVVLTTDTLVLGHDWCHEWSGPRDVGYKAVAQNLADLAAMGAVPAGLLVTLIAHRETSVRWVIELSEAIGQAAAAAGTGVLGGDLSGAEPGTLAVSVVAIGDLQGRAPVTRSGARPGDVVALTGSLGRAAAGLLLLLGEGAAPTVAKDGLDRAPDARPPLAPALLREEFVRPQRRPEPPLAEGPLAADAGAHAMIDLSDGLVRDAGRVARRSRVGIALDSARLQPEVERIAQVLGEEKAWNCVLGGGEEHSLLACFAADTPLPPNWRVIGRVTEPTTGPAVTLDGRAPRVTGWDHFGADR